ncbi:MAG: formyltransferase family protein [Devosia sp.]
MPAARAIVVTAGGVMAGGVLQGLLGAGIEVAEIWSAGNLDHKTTRRLAPNWHVRALAERHGIARFSPPPLRQWDGVIDHVAGVGADLLVTALTYQIVPAHLLLMFGTRAVNFHPALLPPYRGPTPIDAMMLDGTADEFGGVTMHRLEPRVDEGPIVGQRRVPRRGRHPQVWRAHLAEAARQLASDELPLYLAGTIKPLQQVGGNHANAWPSMRIGAQTALAEAMHVVDALGATGRVTVAAAGARIPVRNIARVEHHHETPARIGWREVAVNLADARVTFGRFGSWQRLTHGLISARELLAIERDR